MGIYSTGITGHIALHIIAISAVRKYLNPPVFTDHVPRKYVGCFESDENKWNGKHLSYDMGNNNSPKRCMNLCNTQQFKYAAVTG